MASDACQICSLLIAGTLMQLFDVTDDPHAVITEAILIINSVISETLTGTEVPFVFSCAARFACSLEMTLLADCLAEFTWQSSRVCDG